ncbi:MAG: chorismate mutase, partial [Pseudomonadota bacterium]|nr:chorismate mutase [Pseudomonadota bacterium]
MRRWNLEISLMTDESKEMDLDELRQKIDAIDQKLLVLINDRASYALQVADAKTAA